MQSPGQTVATLQRNMSQHCWAQHVACVRPPCCDMLAVVGSTSKMVKFFMQHLCRMLRKISAKRSQHANATCRNIVGRNMLRAFGHRVATFCDMLGVVDSNLTSFKLEPTTPNMLQHIATRWQTHATCCAQQCCDVLCWHVAILWPGFNVVVV